MPKELDHLWWEREKRPGSFNAVEAGCLCARTDNHYGRGYHGSGTTWVVNEDCPVHGPDLPTKPAEPS